jgi:hypothetical protein
MKKDQMVFLPITGPKMLPPSKKIDLELCTSLFQYLSTEELELVIPVMVLGAKCLYLTVPTDLELKRQRSYLELHARFAISRTKGQYRKLLKDHFTIMSSRLLESK